MSFTNAPVTRLAVMGLVAGSILASILDVKHYFYILIDTHIWRYRQFWRLMAYQLCYANSSEVLFAAMTIYNLRIIERMWGSRKFAVSCSRAVSLDSQLLQFLTKWVANNCVPSLSSLSHISSPPVSPRLSWLSCGL